MTRYSSAIFTLLSFSLVRADRDLVVGTPCLSLQGLSFDNSLGYKSCDEVDIVSIVTEAFDQVSCGHNAREELILLTGTSDLGEAKNILLELCTGKPYTPCTSWDEYPINGCDFKTVMNAIETKVTTADKQCEHDALTELLLLTGSKSLKMARSYIDLMCTDAWNKVLQTQFTDIDSRFDDTFMSEYFNGFTFLNTETGNFQGNDNPTYPVSEESHTAGERIAEFRVAEATSTTLSLNIPDLQCRNQAIMCCFGRDRQSNDKNGNCDDNDCTDKDPGDNSNLCYTDFPTVIPYPEQSEGAIHCHGLAWGEDVNGFESRLKYNNLFYISMYDHMYTRGYVEKMVPDDYVPMCGCIEDMPPVSRADCTEVSVTLTFYLSLDVGSYIDAEPGSDLNILFNQCKGINFANGVDQINDLASYTNILVRDGKMRTRVQRAIFDTLVGFKSPNDNANEESCNRSYKQVTGQKYVVDTKQNHVADTEQNYVTVAKRNYATDTERNSPNTR
jgi:hypothetical protein